ncbi:hypothetical protein LguiA_033275 [Lonicera macranthoides]
MFIKTWLAIQIENLAYFHMENQFLNRVAHLFPSSCQFPSASDIIQTTSISPLNSNNKNRTKQHSSSKGEWFSSEEDEEEEDLQFYGENRASFSLSSGSLESFRRNLVCSRREECKSSRRSCGSHLGRCSLEIPAHSRYIPQDFGETVEACRKTTKSRRRADMGRRKTKNEFQGGSEVSISSTELYYSDFCRKTANDRRKTTKNRRRTSRSTNNGISDGVEDSYAMEKNSRDPYNDFRKSMLEMIVEKQIFGAKQLERLFEIYLSLNSCYHHEVITLVYSEICEALIIH